MGARNRGGIGLSYRPARLHRLAEFIPWNRFPGPINVLKYGVAGRYNNPIHTRFQAPIDCLKIPAQICEAECKIAARPRLSSTAIIVLIAASTEFIAPLQSAIRLLTCGRDP
jgi:hypothetical protein